MLYPTEVLRILTKFSLKQYFKERKKAIKSIYELLFGHNYDCESFKWLFRHHFSKFVIEISGKFPSCSVRYYIIANIICLLQHK